MATHQLAKLPIPVRKLGRWLKASPLLAFPRRIRIFWFYYGTILRRGFRWSFGKTAETNFLYGLTSHNYDDLASSVASLLGQSPDTVRGHFDELFGNKELEQHFRSHGVFTSTTETLRDVVARRVVWFAIARIVKPKIILETGVEKGVGACVLCAALKLNSKEGNPGKYFGTEIDPRGGSLIAGPYADVGTVLIGDSIVSIKNFDNQVDLFINDSDHDEQYEAQEYVEIYPKLSQYATILGDNSHSSGALREWSHSRGRPFFFLDEKPSGHWYPGAGVGISLPSIPLAKSH